MKNLFDIMKNIFIYIIKYILYVISFGYIKSVDTDKIIESDKNYYKKLVDEYKMQADEYKKIADETAMISHNLLDALNTYKCIIDTYINKVKMK